MTPKPFDPNKPVQTRDGRKARILCTDRVGTCPIVALVTNRNSTRESVYYFDHRGFFSIGLCSTDLVNIPERRSVFRLLYSGGNVPYVGDIKKFPTLQAATSVGEHLKPYLAVLEFVYEDDEIVDVKLHPRQGKQS